MQWRSVLDSAYRGAITGYKITLIIVGPFHITLHFLLLYTLKIGLKLHVCELKIFGLAMPIHMSIFHQDFPQLIFHQGGPGVKSPMVACVIVWKNTDTQLYAHTQSHTHTKSYSHTQSYTHARAHTHTSCTVCVHAHTLACKHKYI